jgi:RNA-directed DNA polymerase
VLIWSLVRINDYLMRWSTRKYKRLRDHPTRARELLGAIAARQPDLFAHWVLPRARPQAG